MDSLVVPLLSPAARLMLRFERGSIPPDARARLQAELDQLEADPDLTAPDATTAVVNTGTYVLDEPVAIYQAAAHRWLGVEDDLPIGPLTRAARNWWSESRPPLPHAALVVAALGTGGGRKVDFLLGLDPTLRDLNHAFFHYARSHGVADWPSAHRASLAWWSDPSNREAILIECWRGVAELFPAFEDAIREDAKEEAKRERPKAPLAPKPPPRERPAPRARQPAPASEHAERAAALQRELDVLRAQSSKRGARIRELDAELAPLRQERDRAVAELQALRALLVEVRETEHTGHPDPIEPPAESWPADLLAGVTIALFTGRARAGARAALAEQLRLAGAEVEVFHGNAHAPGRQQFAPGTTVICDVRFMGHSDSHRVKQAAEKSGVDYGVVDRKQGGVVRAVAEIVGRLPE
jgi:hypothetical protein